jgi:prolyl-tRNA synthetase
MGSYGIGIGRLMAAAVEQNHDENGIIWPASIAPYQVYLCPIFTDNTRVSDAAENLYHALEEGGISTLVDDRSESPGVKFNDADLLGLPLRITISPRTIENRCAELKWRDEKSSSLLPLDGLAEKVKSFLQARSTAKSGT